MMWQYSHLPTFAVTMTKRLDISVELSPAIENKTSFKNKEKQLKSFSIFSTKSMRNVICIFMSIVFLLQFSLFGRNLSYFVALNVGSSVGYQRVIRNAVPVFVVNLDESITRRLYITSHLHSLGISFRRIRALSEEDSKSTVDNSEVTSVLNIVRKNQREIACIASHLIAIHTAVHDKSLEGQASLYALILEDDVHFEMDVDFAALARRAPDDFSVLQLSTTNGVETRSMWTSFLNDTTTVAAAHNSNKHLRNRSNTGLDNNSTELRYLRTVHETSAAASMWRLRDTSSSAWSTQAYLVHKGRIRALINRLITTDPLTGKLHVRFVHPNPNPTRPCPRKPCLLPYRIVADIYLYALFNPAYVSRIPMFNVAPQLGSFSTIKPPERTEDGQFLAHHGQIEGVLKEVRRESHLLPSYIKPYV